MSGVILFKVTPDVIWTQPCIYIYTHTLLKKWGERNQIMPRNTKKQNWWKEKRGTNSTLKKGKTTNTLSVGKLSFGVLREKIVRPPSFFSPSPPPIHFLSYFPLPFFITTKHTLILDNIILFLFCLCQL